MPPTATKTADEVLLGAGTLYAAPIGTAEPTDNSTALPSAWREVGYTDDGSTLNIAYTNTAIKVEEEFYPAKYATTDVEMSVDFSMKQASRRNLALALNAGANAANDDTDLEPPAPGTEVRIMLVFESEDGARWVFRQCFQGGSVAIARKKAPDAAMIPVSFRLEKPDDAEPWILFPTADGLI